MWLTTWYSFTNWASTFFDTRQMYVSLMLALIFSFLKQILKHHFFVISKDVAKFVRVTPFHQLKFCPRLKNEWKIAFWLTLATCECTYLTPKCVWMLDLPMRSRSFLLFLIDTIDLFLLILGFTLFGFFLSLLGLTLTSSSCTLDLRLLLVLAPCSCSRSLASSDFFSLLCLDLLLPHAYWSCFDSHSIFLLWF